MDPHDDAADTTGGWIIDRDEFLKLDRGQKGTHGTAITASELYG